MGNAPVEVAVLIVCYNGRHFLDECLTSVLASVDPSVRKRVVVVDNASTDGSGDLVRGSYPQADLVVAPHNLGFAGGNNLGWAHIRQACPAVRYVYLLNQDTMVASGFLEPLVEHLEAQPQVAAAQSKLMLHQTDRVNSAGNRSHYLGFGYTLGFDQPDRGQFDQVCALDYASGACVLVRASALAALGLFDERFFMYLEDAELSWKLRLAGLDVVFIPASVVYHKYRFDTTWRAYGHLERNRLWLLLVFYRWRTLLLLLPAIVAMELGQLLFAASKGALGQKLRAYGFFLRGGMGEALRRRAQVQATRTIGDRPFMTRFAGRVEFPQLRSRVLDWIANPLLEAYWRVVRVFIRW